MEISQFIPKLYSLSDKVRSRVDNQLYLMNHDVDAIDEKVLVNDLFDELISDITDIGIEFHCSPADLYESFYSLNLVLRLADLVLPASFYTIQKQNSNFRDFIKDVLNGSGSDEPVVCQMLEYYAIYIDDTFNVVYDYFYDKIISTDVFDDYLLKMFDLDTDIVIEDEINLDLVNKYLSYMNRVGESLSAIKMKLAEASSPIFTPLIPTLEQNINKFIMDSIAPDTINQRAWLYSVRQSTQLSPTEKVLVNKYRSSFLSASPFYSFYYRTPSHDLNINDLLCLLLRISLFAKTPEDLEILWDHNIENLATYHKYPTKEMLLVISATMAIIKKEIENDTNH